MLVVTTTVAISPAEAESSADGASVADAAVEPASAAEPVSSEPQDVATSVSAPMMASEVRAPNVVMRKMHFPSENHY